MNFAQRLENFGERTALILEDHSTISYAELARRADAVFANAPAVATARTPVAIECTNALPAVCAWLGALRRRVPALLVDAGLDDTLREPLYARFGIASRWSAQGQWISTGCPGAEVHADLALLLSTSGSTGAPKLVRLSESNVEANARSIARCLAITPDERPITTLPIHYSYGLSVLNSHLFVGATILLTSQPVTMRPFWDFLCTHEATSLAGVPATYDLLGKLRFERMGLPSLHTLTQAGGRLAPDQVRHFAELATARGQRFVVMYGQTEATARIAWVPPERLIEKIGSVGIAIPDGCLELVDANGQPVEATGVVGELRYRGPNVMLGYAIDAADLARGDDQHGVLDTGDLATLDEEGYVTIVGRRKRFIKIFGNRIGLDELEAQLRDSAYDVAVTGRDDLLVVAQRGGSDDGAALAAHLTSRYRLRLANIRVVRVADFPRSNAGKVLYGDLLTALAP